MNGRLSVGRRAFVSAGVAAAFAGCTGVISGGSSSDSGGERRDRDIDATDFEDILEEPTVPLSASLSEYADAAENSSASKDSIPAIDDPTIVDADAGGSMLDDDSVIFGVEIDGDARAYPHSVVVWHEIVNDILGGTTVSITYCPLTGTAIGYRRGDTTFGVEGWLINSNLILFDRNSDSWWPQILGTAVDGGFTGRSLPEIRVVWTTWGRWSDVYPDTTVLTDDTDHVRDYGRDPYGRYTPEPSGYYASDSTIFPVMFEDDRLHPKEVVMGSRTADGAIAFGKERLREERLLSGTLGDVVYLAVYDTGLDTAFVYRDPDGETTDTEGGVSIETDGDEYILEETSYAADQLPLEAVNVFDAMWFSWVAFYPDTELVA